MLSLPARCLPMMITLAVGMGAAPLATASPKSGTVFYTGVGNAGLEEARPYAEQNIKTADWTGKPRCSTGRAVSSVRGKPHTLTGWSLGRLGPIYYLASASDERKKALRNILLFDPGAYGELHDKENCDRLLDVDGLLAKWLKMNKSNRLVILAGRASLEADQLPLFRGLSTYYLPKIAAQNQAGKALICVVEKRGVPYSHEQTFISYARMIADGPRDACPKDFQNRSFYGWRPGAEPYANTLVKWNAEKPAPQTTWLVGPYGQRSWVPNGGIYQCLAAGRGQARLLMGSVLDNLPVRPEPATCQSGSGSGDQGGGDGGGDGADGGILDVLAISKQDVGSGRTAIHVLDGASGFSRFAHNFVSVLHATGADFDFVAGDYTRDGVLDVLAISKQDVGSGRTAIHVLDGASGFSRFAHNFVSVLHATGADFDFVAGDYTRDGVLDVLAISKQDVGSGRTAIHVLDGASGFSRFAHNFVSVLHATGADFDFVAGDYTRDGVLDVLAISKQDVGSGRTAIHVLDGASGFSRFAHNFVSVLHATGADFDFVAGDYTRDGVLDVLAISKQDVGSGRTAIHVLDGASGFSRFAHNFVSVLHATGADFDFVAG